MAVAALLVSWPGGVAAGQDVALAGRRPRFLLSTPSGAAPVEIDAGGSAALRRLVSLNFAHPTVGTLLESIERQTGIKFAFNVARLNADRSVELQARKITVAAALTAILLDTGLDVLLGSGNHIVLVDRASGVVSQAGAITGRVTDATTGIAVAGVEVFLGNTRWKTATDTAGRYRLAEVEPGSYMLQARRLGYAKQSRNVTVRADREDTVNVALEPVATRLDELVTTATGQQRRRDLGNDITTIQADSVLRSAPIKNLTDLLAHRVPGLTVQHTSGAPGDPAKLRLQGLGSALRSNDPVFIVDGVRIFADQSSARAGNLTNLDPGVPNANGVGSTRAYSADVPAPSPLDQIDPNTIEKIEVFKGPSAATLYGADAANGVVVITTKRGKPGPTRWEASVTHGRTHTPGQYPTGYYRWGHDLFQGVARFCTLLDNTCVPDSLVHFQALNDPTLTVFGHGHSTALSLMASGGTQTLTYAVTGSYGTETGLLRLPDLEVERFRTAFNQEPPDWMRRPHHLEKWSVSSNVTARLGATADVTLSTALSREEQQRSQLEQQVATLAGTYIDRVNGIYYRPSGIDPFSKQLALKNTSTLLEGYYTRQTASSLGFMTSLTGNWRPRSWFAATGTAGINVIPRDDQLLRPGGLVFVTDSGAVVHGTGRSLQSTVNLNGQLTKPLGWGFTFQTNVGSNLQTTDVTTLVGSAAGLVPGTSSVAGANRFGATELASRTSVYGWYVEPRVVGQRLTLSTGLRLDGGSAYGTKLSGGVGLPKLGASWVVSEEPWFPFTRLFNSLRLRGAYGRAQVQPSPADRLRLYQGSPNTNGSLYLTTLGNQSLRPERSGELSGGFDADLLQSRVSLEVSLYRKLTIDALMPLQVPGSVNGGGTVLTNVGNIRNRGVNLTVQVTPVRTNLLTWNAQLLYNSNSNILVKLGPGVLASKVQGLVEGYPIGSRWSRPILDFFDVNGDGAIQRDEIQVGDSLVYVGRLYPAYTSSLFSNVVLFGGALGVTAGFTYDHGATQIDQTARTNWVLSRPLVDPSTPLDQQAAIVAAVTPLLNVQSDYGLVQQLSTFRFNSLSVAYRVPSVVTRRLGAQRMAVALQGSNLGVHTTYRGMDPDVSAWSPGENIVDTGQLPQPRLWQLRVDLSY